MAFEFPTCRPPNCPASNLPAPWFPNVPSLRSQKSDQRLKLYLSGNCDPTAHDGGATTLITVAEGFSRLATLKSAKSCQEAVIHPHIFIVHRLIIAAEIGIERRIASSEFRLSNSNSLPMRKVSEFFKAHFAPPGVMSVTFEDLRRTKASETLLVVGEFEGIIRQQERLLEGSERSSITPYWNVVATELHQVLKAAESHTRDCCCSGGNWLKLEITQGNLKETFARLLSELEWHTSSKAGPIISTRASHKLSRRRLGSGAFALVRETEWLGQRFAQKAFFDSSVDKDFKDEIAAVIGLHHPNIVHVDCCSEAGPEDTELEQHDLSIVMELMYKSLYTLLHRDLRKPPFSIVQAADLILQIAEGEKCKHNEGPFDTELGHHTMDGSGGSPFDFVGWSTADRFHPKKLDVYSFAIVWYEILTGDEPFADVLKTEVLARVKAGLRANLPDGVPGRLAVLMQECWNGDPLLRPNFAAICTELRFIKGLLLHGIFTHLPRF
ncbi:uncharacterized protein [Physcomitrium patens]|uniref:uncharacterized protein n=1 Tax=Physcomitrium patens TaxID=3218 RepID=UPI000D16B449|nr:tyrosine-protein kinase Srms-like [Physcomitrium patens]|eukprot:XP_024394517.1 tyrosine-protein kinase Srms-like [Physcomitrella patens]